MLFEAIELKIEVNRRMNETLEAMARAIFKSWFVDFDPVRAKAAGATSFTGMPQEVFDQLPASFEPSELGEIPAGWEVVPLYDTAKFVNGAAFKSSDFCEPEAGLPIIKIAELKSGVSDNTKYSKREIKPDQIIENGDVLYSWSGSPETSLATFIWTDGKGLLNQHIFKVINETNAEQHFVYYLLQNLRNTLINIAKNKQTTGLGHVTVRDMKSLIVCVPPSDFLKDADRTIGNLFDKYYLNKLENKSLTRLRDTLLPRLISGELSVADAESQAEEVL